jgi:hypothetical protein
MTMQQAETRIGLDYPVESNPHLRISLGGCRLNVAPSTGEGWVEGVVRDESGAMPPKIEQSGSVARISQEYRFGEMLRLADTGVPEVDLILGRARPYMLTLELGASESIFDLGGLPLTRVVVKQGAGKASIDFSAPNPQPMNLLDIDAGAVAAAKLGQRQLWRDDAARRRRRLQARFWRRAAA